jgi:carbamoyl-phosphate synthase large subunit
VPVFSFEKLSDADAALGPEMKSTGEVLGVGKTLEEALFKGLLSAGFKLPSSSYERGGVLISVNKQDRMEIVRLAKTLDDLGMHLYATPGTARSIAQLGIDVEKVVNPLCEDDSILELLESATSTSYSPQGKSWKCRISSPAQARAAVGRSGADVARHRERARVHYREPL